MIFTDNDKMLHLRNLDKLRLLHWLVSFIAYKPLLFKSSLFLQVIYGFK